MPARVAHLVGLLHRQDACGIGPLFELWPHELRTARLDDEVGASAAAATAGVTAAAPRAAGWSVRQTAHALDETVPFDVGIKHVCRADRDSEIASRLDRVDGDNRRRAG